MNNLPRNKKSDSNLKPKTLMNNLPRNKKSDSNLKP
jgi:hypothetical protein